MAGARTAFELVVGLGNVGARYAATRHNAGFWYADGLAARLGEHFRADRKAQGELARLRAGERDVRLLKPSTLMNHSGRSVAAVARFLKIAPAAILVAHDDLDLPPGTVRLKFGGGHGGHNGLRDLDAQLGTRDYWRLRIGIGHPGTRDDVVDYVLTRPSPDERRAIEDAIERALEQTERLLFDGDAEGVMQALHTGA
ncbi:MAG: aminoacyl-tRNA hydrolase [Halofilum sp. (in: g-proteobacteria)]|nr:aminoacyl-tRNA hydrolase [Halofilum sp. (in: g-proteobacteria)]